MADSFRDQYVSQFVREGLLIPDPPPKKVYDDIDLFAQRVRETREELEQKSTELGEIRATLVVNFGEGRRLAHLHTISNPDASARTMMFEVLEALVKKLEDKQ